MVEDTLMARLRQGVGAHGYLLIGEALAARAFFEELGRGLAIHPSDIVMIAGETLSLGEVRQFITRLFVKPFASTHTLALIEGDLHEESQAALLKIIEEPPGATLIFCSVRHRDDIGATLRSRLETIRLEGAAPTAAGRWPTLAQIAAMPLTGKLKFAAEVAAQGHIKPLIDAFMLELRSGVYYDMATQEKLRFCLEASRELSGNVNARLLLENLLLTIT